MSEPTPAAAHRWRIIVAMHLVGRGVDAPRAWDDAARLVTDLGRAEPTDSAAIRFLQAVDETARLTVIGAVYGGTDYNEGSGTDG